MANVPHVHDFAQVNGGWQCILSPCNLFVSAAVVQANNNVKGVAIGSFQDIGQIINHAAKKAGF